MRTGLQRDPADEAFLAPLVAKARNARGEEAFSAAKRVGHALAFGGDGRQWGWVSLIADLLNYENVNATTAVARPR